MVIKMLREDIKDFVKAIPNDVCIVAATKYVKSDEMLELLDNGINNFGENRVDSFLTKYEELKDKDITWHFIGHLQRNKAKDVINKIDYLHSLDSMGLAKIIDKERTTPLNCFIEVSINLEENKNGVEVNNIDDFIKELSQYKKVNVVGLMMMAIASSSHEDLLNQFKALADLRDRLCKDYNLDIPYLSMGMSDDYNEAIESGATHIRLGRILWKN